MGEARRGKSRPQRATQESAKWTPDLSECRDFNSTVEIPPYGRMIVRMNLDLQDRVVEFNIIQQVRVNRWETVCRACTHHAELHIHWYTRSGYESREVLRPINHQHDVMRAYEDMYERILADWDDNVRRWNGER